MRAHGQGQEGRGHVVVDMPGGRDASLVRLQGRLGGDSAKGVERAFADADARRRGLVVVDMSAVPMLASMVIRELLRLSNRVRGRDGRVVLSGLSGAPLRSLQATGLLDSFETAPDAEAALGGRPS